MTKTLNRLLLAVMFIAVSCQAPREDAPSPQIQTDDEAFSFIDIGSAANRGFVDKTADDSLGGWADFGPEASLDSIGFGRQVFEDSLIPFSVIDPGTNNGASVIVLSGPTREEVFPRESAEIRVGGKYSELYFLHTSMYVKDSDESLALVRYRIAYEDGSVHDFECRKGIELGDWWDPPKMMPGAWPTYREGKLWLMNSPWKNPNPEKQIEWIQMESTGNAIPILVAITGANNPVVYDSFKRQMDEKMQLYSSRLKVALVQMPSVVNLESNVKEGDAFCREAKAKGADIVVFPEMFSMGYATVDPDDPNAIEAWKNLAVPRDGPFVTHFQDLARELEMAIVVTYLESRGGRLHNSATLFDRNGVEKLTYAKVHTLDFYQTEASLEPGEDFYVTELDTRLGPVKTGIMICYDREFPESARVLMLKGAELILTPNACTLDPLRIHQFQARAWENAVVTAMANYVGEGYNGHSCSFGPDGEQILMAGEDEGVVIAEIDLFKARQIREETYWGNAYRRPHRYRELISPDVDEVFTRENAFGRPFDRTKR